MRRLRWLCALAFALALTVPSAAMALTPDQQQAVDQVEGQAASLPAAGSEAQLQGQVGQVQGAVNAAVAKGKDAVAALVQQNRNPAVAAAVLKASPAQFETHTAASVTAAAHKRGHRVHAAGCYGAPPVNKGQWTIAGGANVGEIDTSTGGYCGLYGNVSGVGWTWYFTSYSGPNFRTWSWGPYCIANYWNSWGWDVWPSWIHYMSIGSIGVWTPWGSCDQSGSTGHAPLRIAASGYWDFYNDWGF